MQGKAEVIIENVAGCGKFQVTVSIFVYFLANSATAFTMLLMSFGVYNPGWRCNDYINSSDSSTLTNSNFSFIEIQNTGQEAGEIEDATLPAPLNNTSGIVLEYPMTDNCPLFESCKDVEFDPSSVTIVSQWGLICNKQWIPSIITSLQMAGLFIGSFLSGHIGDAFGRKPTIYGAVLSLVILNFASIFSVSWEMFAALRFIIGIAMSLVINLYYVFAAEFVPEKWRSVLQGIPAWNISSTFFTLACMGLKNWRYINIVAICIGCAGFVPVFWVPESLRWLEVKDKSERFKRAAEKSVRMNGKTLPTLERLREMAISTSQRRKVNTDMHKYNIFHMFKNGYAKRTILLSFPWLAISAVSYALVLGVKVLQGHFYTNLIISNAINVPFAVFPILMPNLLGRKKSILIFCGVFAGCLLGAAIMEYAVTSESARRIGIPTLIFIGKASSTGVWCVLAIFTMELFPTVIRGLGMSWGNIMARIGGIISPFLIPNTEFAPSVAYTIMAALMFICFGIFLTLPETKGQPLQDTYRKWNPGDDDVADHHPDTSIDKESYLSDSDKQREN